MRLKLIAALSLCIGLPLSGCSMINNMLALKSDLREIEETIEVVSGVVVDESQYKDDEALIIAVLMYPDDNVANANSIQAYRILRGSGNHFIFTQVKSDSTLAAFKDLNGNYILDEGEPSVFSSELPKVSSQTFDREKLDDNTLVLSGEDGDPPFNIDVTYETVKESIAYMRNIGEVTDFDNPNFSSGAVSLGLWEPLQFAKEIGFGLYLLEPWDPEKDVLLLVHGINGSPKVWQEVIPTLDLERQQILLFQYPSGLGLEASAMILANFVQELYFRAGDTKLNVLAHSMGGLVAKRFIQIHESRGIAYNVDRFVTISTPWGGHRAAEIGLNTAPVVVPVWRDMAPGSDYLSSLETEGLPADIEHFLIFTFADQRGSGEANDGTVTLSSQLVSSAQDQAVMSYGFDEGHSGVLNSDELVSHINDFLKK